MGKAVIYIDVWCEGRTQFLRRMLAINLPNSSRRQLINMCFYDGEVLLMEQP